MPQNCDATRLPQLLSSLGIPRPQRTIKAYGKYIPAVRGEGHVRNTSSLDRKRTQLLPALHIPQARCTVKASACNMLTIVGKNNSPNPTCVSSELPNFLAA